MRAKRFLGVVALGSLVAGTAFGAGCSSTDTTATGGAGTTGSNSGGNGGSSSTTPQVTVGTNVSSGGGGAGGSGGSSNTFATATPLTIMNPPTSVPGSLPDPLTSAQYYKYSGMAGEKLAILTTAKPTNDAFNETYLDLVVTLYDPNQNQFAQNDDPWPRSTNDPSLFTVLPTTGTYYIEVQECNAVFGSMSCSKASDITHKDYTIEIFDWGASAGNSVTDETEPDDTTTQGTGGAGGTGGGTTGTDFNPVVYVKDTMSSTGYDTSIEDGTYMSSSDIDVFTFTPPTDVAGITATTRAHATFWLQPSGKTDGDGATSPIGVTSIIAADGVTVLGQLDGSTFSDEDDTSGNGPAQIDLPITLGQKYFLVTQAPASFAGANNFYVFIHGIGGGNPVEAESLPGGIANSNDTPATAETLTMPQMNADMSEGYFIEGDLSPGATTPDATDVFKIPSTTGFTTISAVCASQRSGSGLRGFNYQLLGGSTGMTVIGTATEAADNKTSTSIPAPGSSAASVPLPSGNHAVYLVVTAASQDPTTTGGSYQCGVTVTP